MRQAGDGLTCQATPVLCVMAEEEIEEMDPAQLDAELAGQVEIEEASQDDGWGELRLTPPIGPMEDGLAITADLDQPDLVQLGHNAPPPALLDTQPAPDQVEVFLEKCSSPVSVPLLPTPTPPPPRMSNEVARPLPLGATRSSGRLAAKPTSKMSTMDKVLHVLLKKEGLTAAMDPGDAAMERLRVACKQPLPPGFVTAVSYLLAATGSAKGAIEHEKLLLEAAAA